MSAVGHWRAGGFVSGAGSEIDGCVSRGNESIGRKQSSFSGYFPTIAFTAAEKAHVRVARAGKDNTRGSGQVNPSPEVSLERDESRLPPRIEAVVLASPEPLISTFQVMV